MDVFAVLLAQDAPEGVAEECARGVTRQVSWLRNRQPVRSLFQKFKRAVDGRLFGWLRNERDFFARLKNARGTRAASVEQDFTLFDAALPFGSGAVGEAFPRF